MHSTPGAVPDGRDQFALSAWVFLRGLALIHLVAFASYWMQLPGLIGPHGISPAGAFFQAAREHLGPSAWRQLPSLCWLGGSGWFLHVLCVAGIILAALLFAGITPALCLVLLWACYLSLVTAGQVFFGFQWDSLLLETTLLAVLLAPWTWFPLWRPAEPPRVARWLLWWLLFRLMFLSGAVKLASGDPTWRNLTALVFHYETQPLPTPVAWYFSHLPLWAHQGCCALMFVIELVAPFLIFAPRRLRHTGVVTIITLLTLIFLTGNYTFFDLLAIVLCLLCFDDACWTRRLRRAPLTNAVTRPAPRWLLRPVAVFVVIVTLLQGSARLTRGTGVPAAFWTMDRVLDPFRSLNSYGLFAVMTTTRPELIIEGSDDRREWRAYELPHKPGDLSRRPDFIAPLQPRLDWQLWFAALEDPRQNPWIYPLCEHLLRGTPEVLALFATNPFPDHPPRYLRIVRYEYHFTDAAERARNGHWWQRTPLDYYVEPLSLH